MSPSASILCSSSQHRLLARCELRVARCTTPHQVQATPIPSQRACVARGLPESNMPIDMRKLSDLISMQPMMDDEEKGQLTGLAAVLDEPVATVKNMVFKQRGLSNMEPSEVKANIEKISSIVEVPYEQARQMVVIQPALLFDTEKQAEVLKGGITRICYELQAEKDEIVELILKNKSVLHGRQLHLSVADMAHLSMLREPTGRIVSSVDE